MNKVKLVYFDVRGKGELIRIILVAGNVDFTDERITFEEWPKIKPSTPGGQLPVFYLSDGTMLNESMAIAQYLARKHSFIPTDDMEIYKCDRALYTMEDIFKKIAEVFHSTEDKKPVLTEELKKTHMPRLLGLLTKYLKENGGDFFVGIKPTLADLHLIDTLDYVSEEELASFPELLNCKSKVLQHFPALENYLKSRKTTPI